MLEEKNINLENIQTCINGVIFIDKKCRYAKELYQDRVAPDFRLFDLIKTDEPALSKHLSFLLNPKETHGQGRLFLNKFLKRINLEHFESNDLISIGTEKAIEPSGRIDIFLNLGNLLIGIENKPWAADQPQQLLRYSNWLSDQAKNNKKWMLLYLCNNEISDFTLPTNTPVEIKENIIKISFMDIKCWLDECSPYVKAQQVRYFVDSLSTFINENVNGEYEMEENMSELSWLALQSPDNFRSMLIISQRIQEIKKHAWMGFLDRLKKELLNNSSYVVYKIGYDDGFFDGVKETGFWISFWEESSFVLKWQFEGRNFTNLGLGIVSYDESACDIELRERITQGMYQAFPYVNAGVDYEWWPWWSHASNYHNNDTTQFGNHIDSWVNLIDEKSNCFFIEVIDTVKKINGCIELFKK